ncbi:MAG: 16S rRNA (cytosine(1402)-N(4))-methyltransferase RsmH [Syntrophomonadaceae bacterium]|nr:16S rRNA (cytosine(1402)-N(4))-methyltransferase RsmH [Syntrophomonadaceae bacterium]
MHLPVLLQETVSNLVTDPHGVYVDCTLGGGGHLQYLAQQLADDARIVGIEKDPEVLEQTRSETDDARIVLVQSDFRYLKSVLRDLGIEKVDGIMMDLGVSSFQLDRAERGFSFHQDAPLDMRMNREQFLSARDIVNNFSEAEIRNILYRFGEEDYAGSISRAIVNYRQRKEIESTLELAEIIKGAVPARYRREKHPARKSFQALRIAVNQELEALREVLPQAVEILKPGGRLCVISFHSLEDRIVKQFFQEKAQGCVCPPSFPVCVCGHKPELQIIRRKPITASESECEANPRSRSAKLRVAARV